MDELIFYDYTTNTEVTDLDLGSVAPRSSGDAAFRVANPNTTYQAVGVIIAVVDAADGDQLWLSVDGDIFGTIIDVGAIAPDNMSAPFYVRRVTPSTQATATCTAQISARPTDWLPASDDGVSDNVPIYTPDNPPPD